MSTAGNISAWSNHSTATKQNSMLEFIRTVREYRKNRSDEDASLLNRHLQLLGVSIDTSIFDPNTSVVCEFFVSMFDLLSFIEPRSSLAWGCVSVLQTACKNQAARYQLIHTYQFIPMLSRLLGDYLSQDKKIRLLAVLQELSCGVKLTWIIPNLEHIMQTLLRWIHNENENEQVVLLSLGIIMNLCYKNLPGTYMLSKCVAIRKFLKYVAGFKNTKVQACACKLFIIFEGREESVPEASFLKLLEITFKTVEQSFIAKDSLLLRQNVEFYLDVKVDVEKLKGVLNEKLPEYEALIENIIEMLNPASSTRNAGDGPMQDPDCMCLIFKFLNSIVNWHMPPVAKFYERIAKIALGWMGTDVVCLDALGLLKSIMESACATDSPMATSVSEQVLGAMPIITLNLQNINKDNGISIEECLCFSLVMQLFKCLVRIPETRERVLQYLPQEHFNNIFTIAIGPSTGGNCHERANDANNFTPDAFALYVHTLHLIHMLCTYDSSWGAYMASIFKQDLIHVVLAESLCTGSQEIREAALVVASNPHFPSAKIARRMSEMCKNTVMPANVSPVAAKSQAGAMQSDLMCYSIVDMQLTAPDEAIRILNEARAAQKINISTCDVMELYEYKIATMGHAERAAMASVEAASSRCTHLQHQVAQLSAELSRIRQLFLHTQQVQKESEHKLSALGAEVNELRVEKELRYKLQDTVMQQAAAIEELTKQKNHAYEVVIPRLNESLQKVAKSNEKKDATIHGLQSELQHEKTALVELREILNSSETCLQMRSEELHSKELQLQRVLKESEERRNLLDTIMKLTHKQQQK